MVWSVDNINLWKIHFTGDFVFDIMESGDVQEKQQQNTFTQQNTGWMNLFKGDIAVLWICRNSTFKCI